MILRVAGKGITYFYQNIIREFTIDLQTQEVRLAANI